MPRSDSPQKFTVNLIPNRTTQTVTVNDWKYNKKVVLNTVLTSVLNGNYFNSKVSFELVNRGANVVVKHLKISEINFKNQVDVSASSATKDYQYLYDISSSSAVSVDSSSSSASDVANKNTQKAIYTAIKNFFTANMTVTWAANVGTIVFNLPADFSSLRLKGIYEVTCESTSTFDSSSSCRKKRRNNKLMKLALIGSLLLLIIYLFNKSTKLNELMNDAKNLGNSLVQKVVGN